jgi:hypothetical protein
MEGITRDRDYGKGEGRRSDLDRRDGADAPRTPFEGNGKLTRRQMLKGMAAAGAIAVLPTAFAFGPGASQAAALAVTYQAYATSARMRPVTSTTSARRPESGAKATAATIRETGTSSP